MTDIPFDELVVAVQQLSPAQKRILLLIIGYSPDDVTRQDASVIEPLYGKFATAASSPSDSELNAFLDEVTTAWKEDLDEFDDD